MRVVDASVSGGAGANTNYRLLMTAERKSRRESPRRECHARSAATKQSATSRASARTALRRPVPRAAVAGPVGRDDSGRKRRCALGFLNIWTQRAAAELGIEERFGSIEAYDRAGFMAIILPKHHTPARLRAIARHLSIGCRAAQEKARLARWYICCALPSAGDA